MFLGIFLSFSTSKWASSTSKHQDWGGMRWSKPFFNLWGHFQVRKPIFGAGTIFGAYICRFIPTFFIFQISYQFFKIQFRDFGVLFLLLRGRETLASTKLDSSRRVIYDSFREIIWWPLYKIPIDHFRFLATKSPKLNFHPGARACWIPAEPVRRPRNVHTHQPGRRNVSSHAF